MRLSIDSDDPGHAVWRGMKRAGVASMVVVAVNGLPIRQCVTADTKRGIAVVADLDDQDKLQLNSKRDAVKLKVLAGKVSITLERKASK